MKKSSIFYLSIIFLIQAFSPTIFADEGDSINFSLSNNINTNCYNSVVLEGVDADFISQVLLDNEVVWELTDVSHGDKTVIYEKEILNFTVDLCPSESIHTISTIFKNGTMVSQFVEIDSNNDSNANQIIPKAGVYWASKRGLMWIARNISSPTAINWIRTYGGNAAANAAQRHSRYLSRLMGYLARYERVSRQGVYDAVRGGLINLRVHPTAASGIAWSIKLGLKYLI